MVFLELLENDFFGYGFHAAADFRQNFSNRYRTSIFGQIKGQFQTCGPPANNNDLIERGWTSI